MSGWRVGVPHCIWPTCLPVSKKLVPLNKDHQITASATPIWRLFLLVAVVQKVPRLSLSFARDFSTCLTGSPSLFLFSFFTDFTSIKMIYLQTWALSSSASRHSPREPLFPWLLSFPVCFLSPATRSPRSLQFSDNDIHFPSTFSWAGVSRSNYRLPS